MSRSDALINLSQYLSKKELKEVRGVIRWGLGDESYDFDGKHDLAYLFFGLRRAIHGDKKNNIDKLLEIINVVFLDEKVSLGLGDLLSNKTKSTFDANGYYWLICSLSIAVQKNPEVVAVITKIIDKIIEKCDVNQLIMGFSENAGVYDGINALGWLMESLIIAVEYNSDAVFAVNQIIKKIIEKCDDSQLTQLIAGLSERAMLMDLAGMNAFYWMMKSVAFAVEINPGVVSVITKTIEQLIEKCDTAQLSQLVVGLSGRVMQGVATGKNALHLLMKSLNLAAKKNPALAPAITQTIQELIKKCDGNAVDKLVGALVEKDSNGVNGLGLLVKSLDQTADPKIKKKIADLIVALVGKIEKTSSLTDENKKLIFDKKSELRESIVQYLYQIKDESAFKNVSDQDSLLSQLIDHQRGVFKASLTKTREYANGCLKLHQPDFYSKLKDRLEQKAADLKIKISDAKVKSPGIVTLLQDKHQFVLQCCKVISFQFPLRSELVNLVEMLNEIKWEKHLSDNELMLLRNHVVWYLSVQKKWIFKDEFQEKFSVPEKLLDIKIDLKKYISDPDLSAKIATLKNTLDGVKFTSLWGPEHDQEKDDQVLLPSAMPVHEIEHDQRSDLGADQGAEAAVSPESNNTHRFFARGDDGLADNARCDQPSVLVYDARSNFVPRNVNKNEDWLADFWVSHARKAKVDAEKAAAAELDALVVPSVALPSPQRQGVCDLERENSGPKKVII